MNELNKIDQELKELARIKKELKQSIENKTKSHYRKDRASRLIQTGALVEKYFDIHNLSIEEREKLFKMFADFIKANKPNDLKK